jgi:hypothetical protein
MSDLHEEIRRMFEDERREFPPPPDLRSRMVRHAVSGRSASAARRREWVLAIAAAGLAAAVVAGLLLGLRAVRPPGQPAGQPLPPAATASPAQSPAPEQSPVPSPAATAVPTAGPASSSTVPHCGTADLALTLVPGSPGAGQRYARVVLTNRSSHACWTYGFIGIQLFDGAGRPVPTDLVRQPPPAPTVVMIAPNGAAYSGLHWAAVPAADETGQQCEPVPASVYVTPPDETTQLAVPWSGGSVCQHGRIDTGALAPGTGPPA